MRKLLRYRIPRSVLVIALCTALIVGIACAQVMRLDTLLWFWLLLPFALISLRSHSMVTVLFVGALLMLLGVYRGTQYMDKKAVYTYFEGQKVTLEATASTDAVYGKRSQLTFDVRDARIVQPEFARLIGSLQISGFGEPMVYKGDRVRVSGKLFAARGNNSGRISYATLTVLARQPSAIDSMRRKFAAGIQSALPEPVASFALGILVGQRNTLPEEVSEQFTHVGLTHIIAVSGYNLTIIMQAAGRLLQKRSKFQYMCTSVSLLALFLLLAGSSPSLVRASVVCGLGLMAWYYGRVIQPVALLLVAAAITAIANPLYVWGNVSWMLSFLAFFGVLVLSPLLIRRFYKTDKKPGLVSGIIIESLCAEAMTLPYVLYIFGQMSLVAPLANVLVVALVPLAMLLSLFAGLAGMLIPMFAGWIAWPATLLMTYMLDIAAILSRIPHAFIENIGFSLSFLIVSYMIVAFLMVIAWHKVRQNGIITDNTANKPEGA
jgi:competence protein ComEC